MKYAVVLVLALMATMATAPPTGENNPFCDGMDVCSWSSNLPNDNGLPLGSPDPGYCSGQNILLPYNTYWPIGSESSPSDATVTCTFSANSAEMATFYYGIDNDIVSCTLNGNPVSGFPFTHEGCADPDPMTGGHQLSITTAQGPNTLVCVVRDRGYMDYFNACVVPENPAPLPEFSSALIPLAILTIVPALAYIAVSRKRQ